MGKTSADGGRGVSLASSSALSADVVSDSFFIASSGFFTEFSCDFAACSVGSSATILPPQQPPIARHTKQHVIQ
jgi:hypothetical protein